jgi:hypothetical protein
MLLRDSLNPSKRIGAILVALVLAAVLTASGRVASARQSDAPEYTAMGNLVFPFDYRTWPFLGSGLGLTYEEGDDGGGNVFSNVFVNSTSYAAFMESGAWPDRSLFVLEFRAAETDAATNTGGRYQGRLLALEAEVKDRRFEDGWAFFSLGGGGNYPDSAPALTAEEAETCVQCHTEETAVERTFVQFYPTLVEVAREKGTLKPGF